MGKTYGGAKLEPSLSYSSPLEIEAELCKGVPLPLAELKEDRLTLTLWDIAGGVSTIIWIKTGRNQMCPLLQPYLRFCSF